MKLVLAEKPSVAQSIAKVLGAAKREDGYLEGNGYVVSWCVGHLVELAQPEVYDAKYSKWAYADLPIFPMDWQYEVSAGTKKQFGILKKLMAREDVASLVCATDAGREGELIFRLVYHKAGCRKPFERLWISSMEDVAIKEGFENLRSGTEYDALYEAALCRERADWIVGINATRLFSTLYGQTLNVGRVMTPTLAMAVMREAAISAFKPEPFYTVQIGLDGFTAASERFKTKAAAEAVKQSCSVAIVQKAECKEKTEKPPALYDLTSLQREANRVLGYTAQQTLDYTQNLYEKKLVTYPRTDSRFLTEDMAHSLPDLVKLAFHTFPVEDVDNVPVHAEQVVNNKKVTDHHAIIPTRELQKCKEDTDMKNEKWDDVHGNTTPDDRMVAFLESPTDSYAILQLREDVDDNIPLMFANYSYLQKKEMEPEIDRYEVVYHGSISMSEDVDRQLEDLYVKFNIDHPNDFSGHSMSVSDIVALKVAGEVSFHYVDSVGFQKLENFMKSENYLKNAEMAMEDDYGMIDGIINNGKASGLEERPSPFTTISLPRLWIRFVPVVWSLL